MGKESLTNCGSSGTNLNECLQNEFTNNPGGAVYVINSVKQYIKDFFFAAVQVMTPDTRSVSDNILFKLKGMSEEEMGIKRVDQE